MTDPADHAWAMAQQLERNIENAWGAIRHTDPAANVLEFRAALLTAAAHVLVRYMPPSMDLDRQAQAFSRLLLEHMQKQRGRDRAFSELEHLMANYQGPESA